MSASLRKWAFSWELNWDNVDYANQFKSYPYDNFAYITNCH